MKKALENTVGKGENAGNQHFLLFPQCFPLYQREKLSIQQHVICSLQVFSILPCSNFCHLVKSSSLLEKFWCRHYFRTQCVFNTFLFRILKHVIFRYGTPIISVCFINLLLKFAVFHFCL